MPVVVAAEGGGEREREREGRGQTREEARETGKGVPRGHKALEGH
jgi:hypothetical protein